MKIIKFPNSVQEDISHENEPNQLDLYSQLSNCHDSDNITMIIGGNTYTASKLQIMGVLSYYVGMVNMRNMCNLNMNLNFGDTPYPPACPDGNFNNNKKITNPGAPQCPPPPCPKDDVRK